VAEKDVKRLYSTQGVDWTDDESIATFAKSVYANFVAARDASADVADESSTEDSQ